MDVTMKKWSCTNAAFLRHHSLVVDSAAGFRESLFGFYHTIRRHILAYSIPHGL